MGNGVGSINDFLNRAGRILHIENPTPKTRIGCLELDEAEFFPDQMWVPLAALGIDKHIRMKYVPRAEAEKILTDFEKPFKKAITSGGKIPGGLTSRTVKGRTFQGTFRKVILSNYRGRCAMCEIEDPSFLIGAHIVPVKAVLESATDPRNGIALCLIHDRAFEKGYVYIDDDYRITLSSKGKRLLSTPLRDFFIDISGKRIRKPSRDSPKKGYLRKHRQLLGLS